MRRAKIVATLGPATSSYDDIRAIIDAGVDVARMNLSHGSYDVHESVYANVRQAAADAAAEAERQAAAEAEQERRAAAEAAEERRAEAARRRRRAPRTRRPRARPSGGAGGARSCLRRARCRSPHGRPTGG